MCAGTNANCFWLRKFLFLIGKMNFLGLYFAKLSSNPMQYKSYIFSPSTLVMFIKSIIRLFLVWTKVGPRADLINCAIVERLKKYNLYYRATS